MLPPLVTLTSLLLTFQFTFCMNYGKSLKSTTDNKNSSSISDRALSVFSVVKVEKDSLLQKDCYQRVSFCLFLRLARFDSLWQVEAVINSEGKTKIDNVMSKVKNVRCHISGV